MSQPTDTEFNPPPGWPRPPRGWRPPTGWQPDPSWPTPPPGWVWWVPSPAVANAPVQRVPGPSGRDLPPLPKPTATGVAKGRFGSGKRLQALESENHGLWNWANAALDADALTLSLQAEHLQERVDQLMVQGDEEATRLAALRQSVAETSEAAALQEIGLYEYVHPLDDAVSYRAALEAIRSEYKAMAKAGQAIEASQDWQVNNSAAQGRKMVGDFSKLMLRAYNAEADTLVRGLKPYKLTTAVDRLAKTADIIARLGKTMRIRVTTPYHHARVKELELTADYLAKTAEEKERQREERARLREAEKAQREFEREKAKLLKERSHYETVLERYETSGQLDKVSELRERLGAIDEAIHEVEDREANVRTGYVYVISNFGAFGEQVVKIGMTRRLEPMDRVRELGDASVPFRFDVHALIFSKDAVDLENRLHRHFDDRRINRVNPRREFFAVSPAEVREALQSIDSSHLLEYRDVPEAEEWRASRGPRGGPV